MKIIQVDEYTIYICIDIIEWAKEFYAMPEGAELANLDEVSKECMGFAQIDDKLIWIFVPEIYHLTDLKETIAHEVGHIIEFKHTSNAEQIEENDELHEIKAEYYMNYYLLVDKIVSIVIEELI